jgi:hypothetical protein
LDVISGDTGGGFIRYIGFFFVYTSISIGEFTEGMGLSTTLPIFIEPSHFSVEKSRT